MYVYIYIYMYIYIYTFLTTRKSSNHTKINKHLMTGYKQKKYLQRDQVNM